MKVELTESWNRFIKQMIRAKEVWTKHQELLLEATRLEIETQPVEAQRFLGLYERMEFEVMLGNFAFLCMTYGGLESFLVRTEEDERIETVCKGSDKKEKKEVRKDG